jgi:hypothetical protein
MNEVFRVENKAFNIQSVRTTQTVSMPYTNICELDLWM